MPQIQRLTTILGAPWAELTDSSSRLFVGYILLAILGSAALAARRGVPWRKSGRWATRVITHRSFQIDVQLFLAAVLLAATVAPLLSGFSREGAVMVARLVRSRVELSSQRVFERANWVLLFGGVLFLVDDFSRYLLHRALHRVPFLWNLHKVHHSATIMTPLTFKRQHPLEVILFSIRSALILALVGGVFLSTSGGALQLPELGAATSIVFGLYLTSANLRHCHLAWGWGDRVEAFLISPAQHQIHHGRSWEMQNSNFGSTLAIWDRFFGTLTKSSERRPTRFGLATVSRRSCAR